MKPLVLLAVPFYLFSFIFTFSATHILSAWVGLELNLISFVGMLVLSNKGSLDSGSMKYFVSQALGSIILIMSILLSLSLMPISAGALLFGASLLLKLGLFPFHAWFISFISSCEFSYLWAVSIPQKMLPFWVMLSMPANTPLVTFGGLVSIMVSVSSVVKTSRLSLILGYSSLMNSGWFMLLLRDLSLFCLLFFLYGLALGGVTWSLKQNKGKSQFSQTSKSQSWLGALGLCLLFMNLGGLPPFFNMWNKFLLLAELYYGSNLVLLSLFILSAGVFLYMYLSLSIWGASLNKGSNSSWFSGLSKPPILLLFIGSLIPFFI